MPRRNFADAVIRALALALSYLPGYLLLVISEYIYYKPFYYFVGLFGCLLILLAFVSTIAELRGAFPYPDSISGWIAVGLEALATVISVLVFWIWSPLSLLARAQKKKVSFPSALEYLVPRLQKAALLKHRAAAKRRNELSHNTARALCRIHYRLAFYGYLELPGFIDSISDSTKTLSNSTVPTAVTHSRLAILYYLNFHLQPPRDKTAYEPYLILAVAYGILARWLPSLRERVLSSLAAATEERWLKTQLQEWIPKGLKTLREDHLGYIVGVIRQLAKHPEYQDDNRFLRLVEMFEKGTTKEQLDQIRSEINLLSDEAWMSETEVEERHWLEEMLGASVEAVSIPLFRSGNAPAALTQIRGWNWGAFFLSAFWAFAHGLAALGLLGIFLILLTPCIGPLVFAIFLGNKGNELAWKNRPFESIQDFHKTQRAWAFWGIPLFLFIWNIPILLIIFTKMRGLYYP